MNVRPDNTRKPPAGGRRLGAAAGWILTTFGRARRLSAREILQKELPGTTGRMHIRITERIRSTFRHRWFRRR
ncbi:MAG: hypothetical protein IH624_14890 [Phycisphaerae bacterium]|nr:hypothetical protein [Phycisphaerae bacterium]